VPRAQCRAPEALPLRATPPHRVRIPGDILNRSSRVVVALMETFLEQVSHESTTNPASCDDGRNALIQLAPVFTLDRTVPPYLLKEAFDSPTDPQRRPWPRTWTMQRCPRRRKAAKRRQRANRPCDGAPKSMPVWKPTFLYSRKAAPTRREAARPRPCRGMRHRREAKAAGNSDSPRVSVVLKGSGRAGSTGV
jgi:hypothetical protein